MGITTMKLSRNRTGYFIKEGFSSIFTHGLMSFASVCIIMAFLIIMGSFVLIAVNITAIVGDLENENIVLLYVNDILTENEARALGTRIRATPNVSSATFTSREDAMEAFIGKYEETERFKEVDPTWFRHRYSVYVEDIELIGDTQQALKDIYGVEKVTANLKIAQGLVTARNIVSGASIVIVAVLLVISLFIMSNTIKLATFERREEIAIMKMVGATNSFIRWPFIYEGFILGVTGSVAAFASVWALYGLVSDRAMNMETGLFNIIPFANVSLPMFVVFALIGFGVGVGGSGMALNKYLRV